MTPRILGNVKQFLHENPEFTRDYEAAYTTITNFMRKGNEGEIFYYDWGGMRDPEYICRIKIPKEERIPQFASRILAFIMFDINGEFSHIPDPEDFHW